MKAIRTRFAPSPTGSVHIGSIQKMLYSYACAKQAGGQYVLRSEDTDRIRFVSGAEAEIVRVHEILGLELDESPEKGGPFAPYRQSERLDLYRKYAEELVAAGNAYYAFETPEELAEMRAISQAAKKPSKYSGKYRDYDPAEAKKRAENGEAHVVRIKRPLNREVVVEDLIMGAIKFNTDDLDDYILLKSDGYPTYHLAVVVDDHLMEISHVFRGVEWIATSPIHVLLYEFFGWELPVFAHIPNILDPKGGKLSKRSGSVAVMEFLKEGYLPEAMLNFMMLLGWSPKTEQEIFSLPEFVEKFNLQNFNKGNPVFDRVKLNWFNHKYIQQHSPKELLVKLETWAKEFEGDEELLGFLKAADKAAAGIALERDRAETLKDLAERLKTYYEMPKTFEFSHKQLKKLSPEDMIKIIDSYNELTASQKFADHESWESAVRSLVDELGLKPGEVFMTIRVAITGKTATPPLYDVIAVLGESEVAKRMAAAHEFLTSQK